MTDSFKLDFNLIICVIVKKKTSYSQTVSEDRGLYILSKNTIHIF